MNYKYGGICFHHCLLQIRRTDSIVLRGSHVGLFQSSQLTIHSAVMYHVCFNIIFLNDGKIISQKKMKSDQYRQHWHKGSFICLNCLRCSYFVLLFVEAVFTCKCSIVVYNEKLLFLTVTTIIIVIVGMLTEIIDNSLPRWL